MNKELEIPEGYEARIEGNKVILERKESEDERIRKWLIEMVEEVRKANPTNTEHNGNCSEAIAYLEKQKVNTDGDFARGYDCGYECCLNSHGAEWFEKQKEQKPLLTEETELNSIAFLEQLGYTCVPPGAEQKPAEIAPNQFDGITYGMQGRSTEKPSECGEVDKKMLEFMRNHFWHLVKLQDENERMYTRCLVYLDKLKEQEPAEWSEEDEKMRFRIIGHLTSFIYTNSLYGDDAKECIDWLKSHRPQFHWKPSEEQIEALEHFIRSWGESGTMSPQNTILCAAKSLLYDLQKL